MYIIRSDYTFLTSISNSQHGNKSHYIALIYEQSTICYHKDDNLCRKKPSDLNLLLIL